MGVPVHRLLADHVGIFWRSACIESRYDRANRVTSTVHRRVDNTIEETRVFEYDRVGNVKDVREWAIRGT